MVEIFQLMAMQRIDLGRAVQHGISRKFDIESSFVLSQMTRYY